MARPIRVLMVVRLFYPWIGGTERQAHKLGKMLAEKGVEVRLVTGWWFRSTPQGEIIDGISVFRNQTLWEFFGIRGLRKFGGYLYILSLFWHLWRRQADYDLIHVHGLNYHTFAAVLAGRWCNRKTLTKLANSGAASDINKMRQNRQLALAQYMLPTALKCDRFVALNTQVVRELTRAGVPAQKIIELANGVEIDEIKAKTDYALHHPARLIYVGRLHQQKGLNILMVAFQKLLQQQPQRQLCLQLVGDGPFRAELERLTDRLVLTQHVEFVGETDQVFQYLRMADIFVLPSNVEGLSNALLEAMASGLPVVVSNIPGNAEVVTDGKNGLLFAPGEPNALAQCLHGLVEQPNLRARLGTTARQVVKDKYSLTAIADRYIALYQEMLSAKAERYKHVKLPSVKIMEK